MSFNTMRGRNVEQDEASDAKAVVVRDGSNAKSREGATVPGGAFAWKSIQGRRPALEVVLLAADLLGTRVPYLRGRPRRIERACRILSTALGVTNEESTSLSLASYFGDLGMLGVPDILLLKDTRLTSAEKACVDQHSSFGARLLAKLFPDFPDGVEAIWYHHERHDGGGPLGLRGEEIPIVARILAVVEAFESMSNDRPYRKRMDLQAVLAELQRHSGTQFAPRVVGVVSRIRADMHAAVVAEPSPTTQGNDAGTESRERTQAVQAGAAAAGTRPRDGISSHEKSALKATGPSAAGAAGQLSAVKSLEEISPAITKNVLLRLVTKGLELRPMAPVAKSVMAVTANARCAIEEITAQVINDQALSIRILKLANSSVFSRGAPVSNLKTAIGRIGIQEVRNLTMTLNVLEHYETAISQYVDPLLFWEHSIACGVIASKIAGECQLKSPNNYFLLGMLHDLGRLVLMEHVPEEYASVWGAAEALEVPLEKVESKIMIVDHCDIVAKALDHSGFPRDFIIPVVNHHQTIQGLRRLGSRHVAGAAIIALANRTAHALLTGSSGNDVIYPIDELVHLLGLSHDVLAALYETAPDETRTLCFTMLSRGDWEPQRPYASAIQESLCSGIRPLCTSSDAATDAYRLFFEGISDDSRDEPPNIGVIYVADARQLEDLIHTHEARETEAGALPTVVICNKGRVDADHPWLKNRPYVLLRAPVRIASLVNAINTLLAP